MKLFIIDWSKDSSTPLIEYCKGTNHKIIGTELTDGATAYKNTALCKPDAIIINYAVKPAHGRITAQQIRNRKLTAAIPIYFINGDEDDNEKVQNLGICLSEDEFKELLDTDQPGSSVESFLL
ncbi:hypothetical protein [Flavobacterium coralii]|uniref:hypothetical protein n=1 Tax=Flavobacterium coralii TaxID=2838017 RepID=UPI000C57A903|nr:hypothetical protein [Flavobacterium sp.]|tara:strand:+ start:24459 stop:24827 length:369 start_codon:yes stop_codon:yes gene_type:complete